MQLKRSYSRRLKFEIEIYECYFITRHAYSPIGLAVKTSRPRCEIGTLKRTVIELILNLSADRQASFRIFSKNTISIYISTFIKITLRLRSGRHSVCKLQE